MNLSDFRDALQREAHEFSMDVTLPATVRRRGLRTSFYRSVGTALLAIVILSTAVILTARGENKPERGSTRVALPIELADYYDDGQYDGDDRAVLLSDNEIQQHVDCMRREGFVLSDPRRTEDGWTIEVEEPIRREMDSERWREAAFVTCAPEPPPGTGDLIFSEDIMSADEIIGFRACMARQGFPLPAPSFTDDKVWRFNLASGDVDLSDEAWKRAVFVTCGPVPDR